MGMIMVGMIEAGMLAVVINTPAIDHTRPRVNRVHTAFFHPKGNCQIWIIPFPKFDCPALLDTFDCPLLCQTSAPTM